MKWFIDDIEIANQVVIAPMAGIGNFAFRRICKAMDAGLIYTEMVSDKALIYDNAKTHEMLFVDESEQPITMQVFGGDVESIVEAAKIISKKSNAQIIDINMGCPVPKVTKAEAGAKLLLEPDKIYEVVARVVDAIDKPVTVKMRIGWDHQTIYGVEIARNVERAGAKALAVHGRTRTQLYQGEANWDIIREIKREVKTIPVIGNGDIDSPQTAKRRLEESGVDAIMVGRAVLGNPWLIKQMVDYLEKGVIIDEPSPHEKIDKALEHMDYLKELKGEKLAVLEMRSFIPWYIKGLFGANTIKRNINALDSYQTMRDELNEYKGNFVE